MFKKAKKSIGLEINDSSIRVLVISLIEGKKVISASSEVMLESGIVEKGIIKKEKELSQKLKYALNKAKIFTIHSQELHFALPDDLVYTHVFRANIGQRQGIKQVIAKEYQMNIPLTESEGEFSFKVIDTGEFSEHNQVSKVILVAAAKKSLLVWQNFFEKQKIKIEFFDIEALAIFRAMFLRHQDKIFGILDIKYSYSKFLIFSKFGLEYEFSLTIGIKEIVQDIYKEDFRTNRYLIKDFKIEEQNIKLKALLAELKENIEYASSLIFNKTEIYGKNRMVNEIFLSGNGSNLYRLPEYLNNFNLGYKFILARSVIANDSLDRKYFQVLGLALRAWDHNWEKSDPFLPCIGHAYSLKNKSDSKNKRINIFLKFKKYILVPFILLIFIFFGWMLMGVMSNNINFDNEELLQNTEADQLKIVEPVDSKKIEDGQKEIFIIVNNIGGPLNVRQGPGIEYSIIGKINPGSEQVFREEKNNWYRIEWPNEESAWISADYASKSE